MASLITKSEINKEHKAAMALRNFFKNYKTQVEEKKLTSYSLMEPLKVLYKPLLDANTILAKKNLMLIINC